jgi:hypothetical protein
MSHAAACGVRMLEREPKPGAHGTPVAFLHPKDCGGVLTELEQVHCITETNGAQLVLSGVQNRTFGPCLPSVHGILISSDAACAPAPFGVCVCGAGETHVFPFAPGSSCVIGMAAGVQVKDDS